jgi:hypothetical protein
LTPEDAAKFDPQGPPARGNQKLVMDDVEVGLRIARIQSFPFEVGPWQEIPDDVPRSFLGTCDWVRTRAADAGFA